MKLNSVAIRNFRRLENVQIDFEDQETLFVGPNNSGKTSATAIFGSVMTFVYLARSMRFQILKRRSARRTFRIHRVAGRDRPASILPTSFPVSWQSMHAENDTS
ncbi:AAA family ATPase [Paracoccus marinaquae]|uniref:ATP-binding protein n=1 Tax=Paracoccus marinaquae TaxID=2841926 RepID=A0ABS6ANI6_9RHOB|nr:AAA family ATPase [Paracoccus marinaquae]MBU3032159.1 ATP-binding protein [Paracoccus marinaquae]